MVRWRHILSCVAILASLMLVMPAVAPASGSGSSAGDLQYVDPFAGSTTPSPPPSTAPAPAPASAPSATATSASSTAIASATTQPAAAGDPSKTLPYTGLDVSPTVGIGLGLLVVGLAIRRTGRRA